MASSVGGITDYIPQLATSMKGVTLQNQIGVSVLKKAMDQQETAGAALVKMIQETASSQFASTGHIDIRA